jgi:hypothetical protein
MTTSTKARCRVCGCTDDDCMQCIARTGEPCHWVTPDLCSACLKPAPEGRGGFKSFEDTVVSQVDGSTMVATIYACRECSGLTFGMFRIAGDDHVHLQCATCGTSYCQGGTCAN